MASKEEPSDHLVWKRATVDGRSALYGVAGEGLPVLFIHGWGLGQHAYKRSLKRLVHLGFEIRVDLETGDGRHVWAQLTRLQLEHLELEEGQLVYVRPNVRPRLAAVI